MGVIIESGYSLPVSDEPLTHARIAHARNWIQGDVSVSATATDYFLDAPNNSMTFEKWKAYDDFAMIAPTDWATIVGGAISDSLLSWPQIEEDTYRLTEDTSTGLHYSQHTYVDDLGTNKLAISINVKSVGGRNIRISLRDPSANQYFVIVDLSDGTAITESAATVLIYDVGNGWYNLNITFKPLVSGAGSFIQIFSTNVGTISYTGDGVSGLLYTEHKTARANSNWQITPMTNETVDYCCIAAHNIGDWGGRLKVQYDDGAGGYTDIISEIITDNSPIYCIFEPKTVGYYRVRVNNANPTIGVIRFGKSLQMQRPMYGGLTPPILDRGTKLQSNVSETGEFLGRTRIRSDSGIGFSWNNITADWVRDNWSPFQKAVETDPVFIAWRPSSFSEASYAQIGSNPQASNMGVRDLMSLSMGARGIAYD